MIRYLGFALLGCLCLAATVRADWDPGDPSILEDDFLPNLTDTGKAVDVTTYTLAEDFYTADDGTDDVLTGIHLWGGWLNDVLPAGGASDLLFSVGIHEHTTVNGEGKPGTKIWSGNFIAPTGGYLARYFEARTYADNLTLDWLNPSTGAGICDAVSTCYQYNLTFVDGAPELESDEHYWIVVRVATDNAQLGWVTTPDVFAGWSQWGHGGVPWNSGSGTTIYCNGAVPLAFTMTGDEIAVPEPASVAMLVGLLGLGFVVRRRLAG
ncbi:MAG: PEP-CTERM sorting domain-containing protein [Pirellulales bacterium]|nr:PEP-CTERM sorting domain-containing protein [Pirellulales bacterium]